MAAQKAGYKNSEVKSRIFEKASSSITDSGKVAQSIVKNSKNKDVRFISDERSKFGPAIRTRPSVVSFIVHVSIMLN